MIAIVEDDPLMLKAIERLLSALSVEFQGYASAEEFLAGGAAGRSQCIVMDINLGGMSGVELRRKLTSSGIRTPVIFITGADDEALRKEALEAGCVALLRKPFSFDQLMQAITKATA